VDRIRSNHEVSGLWDGAGIVRLDRDLAWRTLLFAALLLWPLILFGRPAYIADSAAYVKGGKASVEFVIGKADLMAGPPSGQSRGANETGEASSVKHARSEAASARGVRSIPYSVLAYLFSWPAYTMIGLALFQTVLAAFACAVVASSLGVFSKKAYLILGITLSAASSLPMFTAFALPDVFAGIVAACLIVLFTGLERLSRGVRFALAAIASLAVAVHASIVPLALWLCISGTGVALWRRKSELRPAMRLAWLWAPLLAGGIITVGAGFVAFGETSVVAKHYPHALARSVSDGPARWFLEKECRTPRYAVCEVFGTKIPTTVGGFLFNDTGLDGRATPEQMDRIRAEESEIVFRAALAYPGTELGNLAQHVVKQSVWFWVRPARYGDQVRPDSSGNPDFVEMANIPSATIYALNVAIYAAIALCTVWIGFNARRLTRSQLTAVSLIISVLAVNAAFCVLASGLSDRYQARLAWIFPLFVLSYVLSRHDKERSL
jgi:hypothetical protein